jgi:hypothetical protein
MLPRIYILLGALLLSVSGFARISEQGAVNGLYNPVKENKETFNTGCYSGQDSYFAGFIAGKVYKIPGEKKVREVRIRRKYIERSPFVYTDRTRVVFLTYTPYYFLFSNIIFQPGQQNGYLIRGPPSLNQI